MKQILIYLKKHWIVVTFIIASLVIITCITILGLTIKSKNNKIHLLEQQIETTQVTTTISNNELNALLTANASLKGEIISTIHKKDSIINNLKHKLNVQANNIYNPAIMSDDSVTIFISSYIHNSR